MNEMAVFSPVQGDEFQILDAVVQVRELRAAFELIRAARDEILFVMPVSVEANPPSVAWVLIEDGVIQYVETTLAMAHAGLSASLFMKCAPPGNSPLRKRCDDAIERIRMTMSDGDFDEAYDNLIHFIGVPFPTAEYPYEILNRIATAR